MPEELIEAAHQYTLHAMDCKVCSNPHRCLCADGVRLLNEFQSALSALQSRQNTKGDYDA